jgi:hypothetical protein
MMTLALDMQEHTSFARILVCWRMSIPGTGEIVCELGRTAAGLELRSGRPGEAVLRTASVPNMTEAFELAERWKTSYARQSDPPSSPTQPPRRSASDHPTILEQRARYRRGGDLRRMSD